MMFLFHALLNTSIRTFTMLHLLNLDVPEFLENESTTTSYWFVLNDICDNRTSKQSNSQGLLRQPLMYVSFCLARSQRLGPLHRFVCLIIISLGT